MRLFKAFYTSKCKGRKNLLFKSFFIWIFNYLNFLIFNTFFVSFSMMKCAYSRHYILQNVREEKIFFSMKCAYSWHFHTKNVREETNLLFIMKCAYTWHFYTKYVRKEKNLLFNKIGLFNAFSYKKCKGRKNPLFKSFFIWIFNYQIFLIFNKHYSSHFQLWNATIQGIFYYLMKEKK